MQLLSNNENDLPRRVKDITAEFTGNYYLKISLADNRNTELDFVGSREDFTILRDLINEVLEE